MEEQELTKHKVQSKFIYKNNPNDHDHEHEHGNHKHHHTIYPNSKHPLGPVTLRLLSEAQILRKSVENS